MVATVEFPTTCNQSLAAIEPASHVADYRFLAYYLESRYLDIRALVGDGLRDGLNLEHVRAMPTPLPPLAEQGAIVRFLDHADRRIQHYIHAKQKLIELLEEQKRAFIHRTVIRGLDPNVRLKPSGIYWLGDIPQHWEAKRLKSLVTRVTSGSRGWSNFAADSGVLFIRIGNLTRTSIDLDLMDVVRLKLPSHVQNEALRTRVQSGDVLLSITAYIGSVAVVPLDISEAYVSQHVACCRLRYGAANPRWIAYVLLSAIGQVHGQLSMYGGTKQGLSLDDVKNYLILLPPLDEQQVLVERIETELSDIHKGITNARNDILLLREFHSRLIADAVAGNLDVREAAARLPEPKEPEPLDKTNRHIEADEDAREDLDDDVERVEW